MFSLLWQSQHKKKNLLHLTFPYLEAATRDVLKNFTKFTEKHLRQSLFFNKVAGLSNFIKKETLGQVFFL